MDNRPLSPHLTVYKPQITSVLSIFHRITGAGLAVSTVLVVFWLASLAIGEDTFNGFNNFLNNPFIIIVLVSSLWALWYHFCTGLRHLYWDMGYGVRFKVCNYQRVGSSDFLIFAYISNTFILHQLNVRRY